MLRPILLLGASGMLGRDIHETAKRLGYDVIVPERNTADITDLKAMEALFKPIEPGTIVINCAAYTKVDDCETERDLAFAVNALGPKHLAICCQAHDCVLVHFSTDYVFDGQAEHPYKETDTPNPINVYGESKLAGERAIQAALKQHYIFRVQWLYGEHGHHFIKTMMSLSETRDELSIVNDQWGTPTWTVHLAEAVLAALEVKAPYGVYHLRNQGETNWCEYADFLFRSLGRKIQLQPVSSDQFPRPAKRPQQGRLDMTAFNQLACYDMPHWQSAINDYLHKEP